MQIVTRNPVTGFEYHLNNARETQIFSQYASGVGSGFGYLSFTLARRIGYDYSDLGYGYDVSVYKSPWKVIFNGIIVKVSEVTSDQGNKIEVWALGAVNLLSNDVFNRVYCDIRLNQWYGSEEPEGSFRPDLFTWSTTDDNVLVVCPRQSANFTADDYTSKVYTFNFGEVAKRLTAVYELALPSEYPGKAEILDGNGNILFSLSESGSGSLDLKPTEDTNSLEIRFYITASGQNTAVNNTVYFALGDLKVYSKDVTILDAKSIAVDIVAAYEDLGLSQDVSLIESSNLNLESAVFDEDGTASDALTWCCKFGNADGYPMAWGISFDNTRRLFVESIDLTNVKYVIYPNEAKQIERCGDWSESAQKAYAVYQSTVSTGMHRTNDVVSLDAISRLNNRWRREAVSLSGKLSESQAYTALSVWMHENRMPKITGSFLVRGGVYTPSGRFVNYDEIEPGGLVEVRDWRAREVNIDPNDYRNNVTTFLLKGVKIDTEQRTTELIPEETSDTFARQMAIISELQNSTAW